MTDPAHPYAAHRADPGPGGQDGEGGVDEFGIDGVEETAKYVAYGGAQHGQNGDGDRQADDRVGQRKAEGHTACGEKHSQGGESVGAGVEPVGDQAARERLFARGLVKFVIPGEPSRIAELLREMAPLFAGRAEVLTSKPYFLEILPMGADKGSALARLAGMLGFDMAEVMAVGDAMNDYTMISRAGWGCAPANAIPAIRDIARVVSEKTNDENAVADLIDRVALA